MKNIFKFIKTFPSLTVIICICLTVIEVHLNLIRHVQRNVITWDIVGYYSYLPAIFIEKDIKLSFINEKNKTTYDGIKYGYTSTKVGKHVIKYSMGIAILYAPFFLLAHEFAQPLGYDANGFSEIYHWCIEYSGLFYLMLGFIFLRKLLLNFYSEKITAFTLACIFFGTNLLCYSTIDAAMSHSYSFSLYAVFLFYAMVYFKNPCFKYGLGLGALSALIILVRPMNIILIFALPLILIPYLVQEKTIVRFLKSNYKNILAYFSVLTVCLLPQLLYWNYVTGHFFVFSYGYEKFYFNQWHLFDCLLGFRKGWLIYTPILFFALAGILFLRKSSAYIFKLPLLTIVPAYIYLVSCWWCWWYGGSFGLRPMIDLYPLLCLPFGAALQKIFGLQKLKKNALFSLVIFCVLLNIYQTFQYKYNIVHYDSMTFRAFKNVFGKMSRQLTDTTLLKHPNYETAVRGQGD